MPWGGFGLDLGPLTHLEVLTALSKHVDVAFFAPVASTARWEQLHMNSTEPLRHPVAREQTPIGIARNRLNRAWARSSEEGHLLLLDAATNAHADVHPPTSHDHDRHTLLACLQHGIVGDVDESEVAPNDGSIVWHRTFGATRQVEALRDHLLHLFSAASARPEGFQELRPRDVLILTPDVEKFAPIVEAVFAGDEAHGLPALPVQVADRSLGSENPVASAALAFLDLLDGRFRSQDVCAFLALPVVASRFGLSPDDIDRLTQQLRRAHMRWGLDVDDQLSVGLPPLGVYTALDALDRILAAALTGGTGPELTFGDIAPVDAVAFDDLVGVGAMVGFVNELRQAQEALSKPCDVDEWVERFRHSVRQLVKVDDDQSFLWRSLDRLVDDTIAAVSHSRECRLNVPIDPADISSMLRGALSRGTGRPRFDTGKITLSSLTALRGVPARVVCLLGMDLDSEPSGFSNPDDLILSDPCVGDRDDRSEYRSQILDAVLAAEDHLILCSTGFDVRSRAEVSPAVALSELIDAIRETVIGQFTSIDHPRQAWSEDSFEPQPLVSSQPWSHDRAAADAAKARRDRRTNEKAIPVLEVSTPEREVSCRDLRRSLIAPVRVFCEDRLGVVVSDHNEDEFDHTIPLVLDPLEKFNLRDQLLHAGLQGVPAEQWMSFLRASGALPPGAFGDLVIEEAVGELTALLDAVVNDGLTLPLSLSTRHVEIASGGDRPRIEGEVANVVGDRIIDVRASSFHMAHLLDRIVDVAVLTLCEPHTLWSATIFRRASSNEKRIRVHVALRSAADAERVVDLLLFHRHRSLTTPVPFFPDVAEMLAVGRPRVAAEKWNGREASPGERSRPWNRLFYELSYDDLKIAVNLDQSAHDLSELLGYFDIATMSAGDS